VLHTVEQMTAFVAVEEIVEVPGFGWTQRYIIREDNTVGTCERNMRSMYEDEHYATPNQEEWEVLDLYMKGRIDPA
jgi:hypothetical protein